MAQSRKNRPEYYPPAPSFVHLNNNLMCAIDIKTTGVIPFHDEIYEICIMVVGSDGMPYLDILPFYTMIRPLHIDRIRFDERMKIAQRKRLTRAINEGIDYGVAIDLLDEWYDNLHLKFRKKIFPLAYNWPLINAFLYSWLGHIHMNSIFSYQYRDILVEANFLNDYSNFHCRRFPFAKTDFSYLLSVCKVEHEFGCWDTLENCRNIAEVHRLICRDAIFQLPYHLYTIQDDELKYQQTNHNDEEVINNNANSNH